LVADARRVYAGPQPGIARLRYVAYASKHVPLAIVIHAAEALSPFAVVTLHPHTGRVIHRRLVPLAAAAAAVVVGATLTSCASAAAPADDGKRTAVDWSHMGEGLQSEIDELTAAGDCNGLTMKRNLVVASGMGENSPDVTAAVSYIDEAFDLAHCASPTE
jgi:hypothetical protein